MIRELSLALAMIALPQTAAIPRDVHQFDLICEGSVTNKGDPPGAFATHFSLDLDRMLFCINRCGSSWHLTRVADGRIEYHYDQATADADHPANGRRPEILNRKNGLIQTSTAGPFDHKDDFTIDEATGKLTRTYDFSEGDIGVQRRLQNFTGQCRTAPFRPFPSDTGVMHPDD